MFVDLSYHLRSLAFSIISFGISPEVGLLTTNPVSFCVSWIVSVSPLFLNGSCADMEFLVTLFSLRSLNMLSYCFMAFIVSAVNLIEVLFLFLLSKDKVRHIKIFMPWQV